MSEGIDLVEAADPHPHVAAPVLVVLPDPEARTDLERGVFGRTVAERTSRAALAVGFEGVVLAPGARASIPEARELAGGDPLGRAALVLYEGTLVNAALLRLMVEHPLEADERFTLYDDIGRPAACFVGRLDAVPTLMPVSEELPWPEGLGPRDVVRLVYDDDRARAENLVLRTENIVDPGASTWRRFVEVPTLRLLAGAHLSIPQLELVALALALASLPLTLVGGIFGLGLGTLSLLLGVHTAAAIPKVRALRLLPGAPATPAWDDTLARATRPLGQAALTGGLTYSIVAQTDRSGVAAVVLLAAGAASVLLCLVQARLLLQGRPAEVFALPDVHAVAQRLGVRWPAMLDGAPVLELAAFVASLTGSVGLPWSIMEVGAVARLWRWFARGGPLLPIRVGSAAEGTTAGAPHGRSEDPAMSPPGSDRSMRG